MSATVYFKLPSFITMGIDIEHPESGICATLLFDCADFSVFNFDLSLFKKILYLVPLSDPRLGLEK